MFSNYGYFRTGVVSTLAQLVQKDTTEVGKNKARIHVRNCKSENPADAEKVDVLYRLERKIIEMLLFMAIKRKSLKMCFEIQWRREIEHVIEKSNIKYFTESI
jgi:DNA primase